jgi:hypothetical protein
MPSRRRIPSWELSKSRRKRVSAVDSDVDFRRMGLFFLVIDNALPEFQP